MLGKMPLNLTVCKPRLAQVAEARIGTKRGTRAKWQTPVGDGYPSYAQAKNA